MVATPDTYSELMTLYADLDARLRNELRDASIDALRGSWSLQRKAETLRKLRTLMTDHHRLMGAVENRALSEWWEDQQIVTRATLATQGEQYGIASALEAGNPATWAGVNERGVEAIAADMAGRRAAFLGVIESGSGGILRQADDLLRTLAGEQLPRAMIGDSVAEIGRAIREGGIQALREGRSLQLLADGIDACAGVTYADGSRHSLQAYGQMSARTGVARARTEAAFGEMQEYGVHLFQVSSHGTLCPLCAPFEGTVWSIDAAGEREGYKPCPVSWPRHPHCRHQTLAYFGVPSEPKPATPPQAAFEGDKAQREWFRETHPERLRAARQGFGNVAEWERAKRKLGDKADITQLRGKRFRYKGIEARRIKATERMLKDPSLSYSDAMGSVTREYLRTPDYAKARAKTGELSPAAQQKILQRG